MGATTATVTTDTSGDLGVAISAGTTAQYNDGKATWVLNAVNEDINDLQSNASDSITGVNLYVTVALAGFESAAIEVGGSASATDDVTITALQVNQAIKEAINSDEVLSKLLEANDGPAETLVVTSKIDGVLTDALTFDFSNTALTATQTTNSATLAETDDFTNAADYNVAVAAAATTVDHAELNGVEVVGADSTYESNNTTTLGTGDDVLVLGTNDVDASNDTVVYTGYDLGNDSIVNFIGTDAAAGTDVLDFTSYLGGAEATAAAVDIAAAAGTLTDNTMYELAHDEDANANVVDFDDLSASLVEGLLNGTGTATDSTAIVATINATNAGDTDYILAVENAQNAGEYKFFHLESVDGSTDFTVELIGTTDFGASIDFEGANIA